MSDDYTPGWIHAMGVADAPEPPTVVGGFVVDEHRPSDWRLHASVAKSFVESGTLRVACDLARRDLFTDWMRTTPNHQEKRESLYEQAQALDKLETTLRRMADWSEDV